MMQFAEAMAMLRYSLRARMARLAMYGVAAAAVIWLFAYLQLPAFADGIVGLLGLGGDTHLGEALRFFLKGRQLQPPLRLNPA